MSGALDAHVVGRVGDFSLDVSLRAEPGTTVAVVGPNGAGKSTAMSVIGGLASIGDAQGTRIELGGRVLDDVAAGVWVPPEQRRIGIVFQDALLFDHLSVLDNVAFGPRSRGASRRAARETARPWIERLALRELEGRCREDLSGGQAQRVAIARALASDPALLLFDEPLSALDVEVRSDVRRMLRTHLGDFGGPRLLVTHDPSDAFLLADRMYVLEAGRVTQSGTPDQIRRTPATPYIAALAGTNLFAGEAASGSVRLRDHDHALTVADTTQTGAVLVTVHPTAVSLHPERPTGSQRNVWPSTVQLVEPLGDTVRVTLGPPLPIAVDVTPGAVAALGLAPGSSLWAAVKATEVDVVPA